MSEKRNVPKLRFSGFLENWQKKILSEVSVKITDGTHDTPKPSKTGVPFLTAVHVKDGFLDFENCYFLPEEVHKQIYKRCNPEYGDLLMVNIGSGTGTSAMVDVDYEFSLKNVALVKPDKKKLDPRFLSQIQRENAPKLKHQLSSGGAQPFLSLKEIGKIKLNLPSLPEQQKIAEFLTAVDKRIELLQAKREKLEAYKKGVMQKIFAQKLRFKADDGSEFSDWEERKLGEVCEVVKGQQLNRSELFETGEFPALNGGISPSGYTDVWNTLENTIAISEGGNSCGFVSFIKTKFWSGGHCYSIQKLKNEIRSEFLFQSLKHNQDSIMALRVGSGLPNIQKKDLLKFEILVPTLEEQNKIAKFLTSLDRSIENLNQQITHTQTWKKGLLQKMFV